MAGRGWRDGRAVDHIDGNPRNNDLSNLRLVGTSDNARALDPADIRTLGLLLQRHGLLRVTMALADLAEKGIGL